MTCISALCWILKLKRCTSKKLITDDIPPFQYDAQKHGIIQNTYHLTKNRTIRICLNCRKGGLLKCKCHLPHLHNQKTFFRTIRQSSRRWYFNRRRRISHSRRHHNLYSEPSQRCNIHRISPAYFNYRQNLRTRLKVFSYVTPLSWPHL